MGSKGSGNFPDYRGSGGGKPGGGGSGGGGGKPDDEERCAKPLTGVQLEEVATSEYYKKNKGLPRVRSKVRLRKKAAPRVAVELESSEEVIGYLPTKYNHVVSCMKQGWEYSGNVIDTAEGKLPKIKIDLTAKQ